MEIHVKEKLSWLEAYDAAQYLERKLVSMREGFNEGGEAEIQENIGVVLDWLRQYYEEKYGQ